MNMISTGTFLNGMDASNKQSELVKKLVAAWEKKNSKAARAGGVSLMALSLAACGGEDTTPFAQSDIDAATAPLTAAVAAAETALAAAQADAAAALVAQSAAETQAAEALVAQAAAEASAAAATVAGAANTVALAAATEAQATAEAALATANAALATANTEKTTLQASYDALVASNTSLQANYDALVAPKVLNASASAVPDSLIGATGNDQFSAVAGTVAATDRFTDTSTTDSDTLTIVHSTAPGAFTSTNIETINITLNNIGALTVDAANITGASSMTVTRGDVVLGGTTLTGNKAVRVDNVDSANLGTIEVGAGTTTVDINAAAADAAGMVLNLNNASGAITVDGAATINASTSTDVRIDAVSNATAAQTGKATVINAAAAGRVDTHANLTGSVDITAPAATAINLNDAQGGATVTAGTTSAADTTITIADVDASGLTLTTGTGSATAAEKQISLVLDGTAGVADAATISGAGVVSLDIDGANAGNLDALTLSGNGAAVTYNLLAPNTLTFTTATKAGSQSVTLAGDVSDVTGVTVTGLDVVDINAEAGGDQAIDTSLFSGVGKIDLGIDNGGGNAVTVVSGSTVEITVDRAGAMDFDFSAAGGGDLTIVAGDDNGASTAVGTIAVGGGLDAAAAAATTTGTVTIEASIANFTATATVIGAAQNLVITGDEDVTLGAVTADSVSAANSTGIINMTSANAVDVVALGSGNDILVVNDGTGDATGGGDTVSTGAGNDTITITDTANAASFDAGAGNDTINVDDVNSTFVVVGGAGTDNFTTALNIISTLVGGDGSDTITIDGAGARVLGAGFAMQGIEKLNITAAGAAVEMSGVQLAGSPTLEITGTGTDDTFRVQSSSTATVARSIDASNVTLATGSDATIEYKGAVGNDTISGGVAAESIFYSAGNDTITGGGTGIDTLVVDNTTVAGSTITVGTSAASTGLVVNLGSAAVSAATITGATGDFVANSIANVGAGQGAYIYNAAAATNNASLSSIEGMENFTSTDATGIEYVVGSAGNNVISTGAGADHILAGEGQDTITGGGGNDTINLGAADAVQDYIRLENTVGNNGIDTITGLGATDLITLDKSDYALNGTATADANNTAIAGATYYEGAAGAAVAATAYDVIALTGASYADVGAAEDAVAARMTSTTDVMVIFHDTGTSQAHMYFDADAAADGNLTATATLITFEGVANAAGVGTLFSTANFELIA